MVLVPVRPSTSPLVPVRVYRQTITATGAIGALRRDEYIVWSACAVCYSTRTGAYTYLLGDPYPAPVNVKAVRVGCGWAPSCKACNSEVFPSFLKQHPFQIDAIHPCMAAVEASRMELERADLRRYMLLLCWRVVWAEREHDEVATRVKVDSLPLMLAYLALPQ